MCLAVPMEVIEIDGQRARVGLGGVLRPKVVACPECAGGSVEGGVS